MSNKHIGLSFQEWTKKYINLKKIHISTPHPGYFIRTNFNGFIQFSLADRVQIRVMTKIFFDSFWMCYIFEELGLKFIKCICILWNVITCCISIRFCWRVIIKGYLMRKYAIIVFLEDVFQSFKLFLQEINKIIKTFLSSNIT